MEQRPPLNIDVTVDDGKYRFTQDVKGGLIIYRHGEEWMAGSFPGVNMVIAMACEIEALRKATGEFCDRVEAGEIRSRRTYAKFCELLGREPRR
jgi:hypothetical protein